MKIPWNCFNNTWQFSLIFHPLQVIFIHCKSRIATAIHGLWWMKMKMVNSGLKGSRVGLSRVAHNKCKMYVKGSIQSNLKPANTEHSPNAGLMLGERFLGKHFVFDGDIYPPISQIHPTMSLFPRVSTRKYILLHKAWRQYLLTCKVSRYYLLTFWLHLRRVRLMSAQYINLNVVQRYVFII